jgi:hypothetical protein
MMRWWVAGSIVLSIAAPSQAQQANIGVGNDFFAMCDSPRDVQTGLVCLSYMRGVTDGLTSDGSWKCVPLGVTYQQRQDILLKYLKENPSVRHLPTASLSRLSLLVAFDCLEPMPSPKP